MSIKEVAEIEHEQWAHWTKYMLDNLTSENIERWKRQIETPYSELSEQEKEADRKWAMKVHTLYAKKLEGYVVDEKCPECRGHGRLPITPDGHLPKDWDRYCQPCKATGTITRPATPDDVGLHTLRLK